MSVKKGKYSLIYASKIRVPFRKDKPVHFMLIIYIVVFIFLSLRPADTFEWWYGSLYSAILIGVLAVLYKKCRLTNLSYAGVLSLLILHSIGAHYTYSLCPVGEWLRNIFAFERNNYDRLVSFAFGLFVSLPIMEILFHKLRLRYIEACLMAVVVVLAVCALDTLAQMYTALFISMKHAEAGLQGDIWNTQKDISIRLLGAVINMGGCIILKLKKNQKIHMVRYRNN